MEIIKNNDNEQTVLTIEDDYLILEDLVHNNIKQETVLIKEIAIDLDLKDLIRIKNHCQEIVDKIVNKNN